MYRSLVVCAGAVLATLLLPLRADAAVIQCFDSSDPSCQIIGLALWAQPFDDQFTISNLSDSATLPAGGATFDDVTLIVDGVAPGYLLGSIGPGPGGQLDSLGAGFFLGVLSAQFEFSYLSSPFIVDLSVPESSVEIFARSAVPEPSALLLLGTGLAVSRVFRRHARHL